MAEARVGLAVGEEVAISGMGNWVAGIVKEYKPDNGTYIVQVKQTSKYVNEASQVAKYGEHLFALSGGIPYIEVEPDFLEPVSAEGSWASAQLEAAAAKDIKAYKQARDKAEANGAKMTIIDEGTGATKSFDMPGGRVTLKGLVARPELNGQGGSVRTFSAERNRFGVLLDGQTELMAIKLANLTFVDATEEDLDHTNSSGVPRKRISTADAERFITWEGQDAIMSAGLVGEERAAALNFMRTCKMVFDALDAGDAAGLAHALDKGYDGDRGGFPVNHREHSELEQTLLLRAIGILKGAGKDDELTSVLRVLLARGADPNLKDNYGGSGLFFAAMTECGAEIATMLLDAGADPTYRLKNASMHGLQEPSALEIAMHSGNTPFADVVRARMPAGSTKDASSPRTQNGGRKKKHERRRPMTPG